MIMIIMLVIVIMMIMLMKIIMMMIMIIIMIKQNMIMINNNLSLGSPQAKAGCEKHLGELRDLQLAPAEATKVLQAPAARPTVRDRKIALDRGAHRPRR